MIVLLFFYLDREMKKNHSPLPSWAIPVVAGGGAGLIETIITYPLDLAKTQQQIGGESGLIATWNFLRTTGAKKVRSLYSGLSAPLLSEVPRRALKFGSNSVYKEHLEHVTGIPNESLWTGLIAGALAGSTETLIHTPFERIKILIQSGKYTSPLEALRAIRTQVNAQERRWKKLNFIRHLYRGWCMYVVRQGVWNGSFFGSIHFLNKLLKDACVSSSFRKVPTKAMRPDSPVINFSIGLISGR